MAESAAMISPFIPEKVRVNKDGQPVISYGLSSYGYDIRVDNEFKVFTNVHTEIVDPKHLSPRSFVDIQADYIDIPPNSFALAHSVEHIRVPPNVLCICIGKSTYARVGVILNTTPFEPAWRGFVTLEISNTTPLPARIYANEGIGQVLFFEGDEPCEHPYGDGKYQDQRRMITLPRL